MKIPTVAVNFPTVMLDGSVFAPRPKVVIAVSFAVAVICIHTPLTVIAIQPLPVVTNVGTFMPYIAATVIILCRCTVNGHGTYYGYGGE